MKVELNFVTRISGEQCAEMDGPYPMQELLVGSLAIPFWVSGDHWCLLCNIIPQ